MKSRYLFFVVFLMQFVGIAEMFSQPLTWDKKYSFPGYSRSQFYKALQTQNSDLYLAGYAETDFYQHTPGFMKIDTNGNKLWSKTFDFPDSHTLITHTLLQSSANSYYSFCFNTFEDIIVKQNGKQEVANHSWLLKLDNNGDTLFAKHFDEIGWVNDLILDNGKLVAVGSTNYIEEIQDMDYVFTKTTILAIDTNGSFLWRKEFMIDTISRANSIIKNSQGHYLITGTTTLDTIGFGYIAFPDKMFLLETDSLGNLLSAYHSDIESSEGKQIISCDDGTYAVIGDGYNNTEFGQDIVLWKFDAENTLLQSSFSQLPRADKAFRFKQTPGGGFVVCGSIVPMSSPNWSPAFFYMKIDQDGLVEWYQHNESSNNSSFDLIINNQAGFYFAGQSGASAILVKTDLEGNGLMVSIDQHENLKTDNRCKVFPNPGQDEITIKLPDADGYFSFSLYDFCGRELIKTAYHPDSWKVNTTNIAKGLYTYKITGKDGYTQSGKWIKK